jgi:hypothetical protein
MLKKPKITHQGNVSLRGKTEKPYQGMKLAVKVGNRVGNTFLTKDKRLRKIS